MSTLLEVSGVTKTFDGFRAINGLSISIGETELRAVIGPNGAGKTTFMDIITGKTKPDDGKVLWGPKSVSLLGRSESQIAMMGIGRKFQRPTVFEAQTVEENLHMALRNPRGPFDVLWSRRTADDAGRVAGAGGGDRVDREPAAPGGRVVPRAEAVAGDRDAVGAGPETALGR